MFVLNIDTAFFLISHHVSKAAQWTKLASPSQEFSLSFKPVNEFSSNHEKLANLIK